MKNFCRPTSHQISSSLSFLASVVNAEDVSETLFVSYGSCELPSLPRETTLYRVDLTKIGDKVEATHRGGKNSLSVAEKSGESNRIEDFKPQLDESG